MEEEVDEEQTRQREEQLAKEERAKVEEHAELWGAMALKEKRKTTDRGGKEEGRRLLRRTKHWRTPQRSKEDRRGGSTTSLGINAVKVRSLVEKR